MTFDAIDAYSELQYAAPLRLTCKPRANEKFSILNAHAIIEWRRDHWFETIFLAKNSTSNI